MPKTTRTHYFRDDEDNRTVVVTVRLWTGQYRAYVTENDQGDIDFRGYGCTRIGAIADLQQQIDSAAHVFAKDGGEL